MNRQRVLVLQTATPEFIRRAMEDILRKQVLGPAEFTVFCRALPEEQNRFRAMGWIHSLRVHHGTRGTVRHLLEIRRDRFDVVLAFFTRDPSYWKMKLIVFACGGRHILLFNEHLGCFFCTPASFLRFLGARFREWRQRTRRQLGYALGTSQGLLPRQQSPALRLLRPVHVVLKFILFPARFVYLLVWCGWMQYRRSRTLRALDEGTFESATPDSCNS